MVLCDRIIYTSAQTENVRGYQIVAYSSGIKEEKDEIEKHSLPYKTIPPDFSFNSFIRFYKFSTGRIGITKLVNTGEDEFGRPNRIYAYTLVMDEDTFYKIGSNPLIANNLEVDESLRGKIDKINIGSFPLRLEEINKNLLDLMQKLMEISLEKDKIVLIVKSIEEGENLLKNLLILFPPKVRVDLSFSTFSLLADEPYRILVFPVNVVSSYSFPPNYGIVDLVRDKIVTPIKKVHYPAYVVTHLKNNNYEKVDTLFRFLNEKNVTIKNIENWYQYWIKSKNPPPLDPLQRGKYFIHLAKTTEKINRELAVKNYLEGITLLRKERNYEELKKILNSISNKIFAGDIFKNQAEIKDDFTIELLKIYEKFIEKLPSKMKISHFETIEEGYKTMHHPRYYLIQWKRCLTLLDIDEYDKSIQLLITLLSNRLYAPNKKIWENLSIYFGKLKAKKEYHIIRKTIYHLAKVMPTMEVYKLIKKLANLRNINPEEAINNYITVLKTIPYLIGSPYIDIRKEYIMEGVYTPSIYNFPREIIRYVQKEKNIGKANSYYIEFLKLISKLTKKPPEKVIKLLTYYVKYIGKKDKELTKAFLLDLQKINKKVYKSILNQLQR